MMYIVFLVVDRFTPIVFLECLCIEWPVHNLAIDAGIAEPLVSDGSQERRAPRSWSTKHENHLTWLCHTAEVLEDIKLLALLPEAEQTLDLAIDIEEINECFRKDLDEDLDAPEPADREI